MSYEDNHYQNGLKMKKNHQNYPCGVNRNYEIILRNFNKHAKETKIVLSAIAELCTRGKHISVFKLTEYSLYAAVSSGITPEVIIQKLAQYSDAALPVEVIEYIHNCTQKYGKASLILKKGKMYIESNDIRHLGWLTSEELIRNHLVLNEDGKLIVYQDSIVATNCHLNNDNVSEQRELEKDIEDFYKTVDKIVEEDWKCNTLIDSFKNGKILYSVEIKASSLEEVQKNCRDLRANLLTEYDFHSDKESKNINGTLRYNLHLRPYQTECLKSMLAKNRARSGIIVLPCGAGKTLVGVSAAMKVGKKCIIFCPSYAAVLQWYETFVNYTTLKKSQIALFTGSKKDKVDKQDIMLTTYQIIATTRKDKENAVMQWIKTQDWGLSILDEVHMVVAEKFRKVLTVVKSHCQLGLTATLVREDDKVEDLHFLIGPKLYEADWMDLQEQGFIAKIKCVEVTCPLSLEFFHEYHSSTDKMKRFMAIMNPEKIRRCQFLMQYHENRNDKILIFMDNIVPIRIYSNLLKRPYMDGSTKEDERIRIMNMFKTSTKGITLLISRMGDIALDIPEASVIIQISAQGGSRRQETQRLGRITRVKKNMNPAEINGYFYSLITEHSKEVADNMKRQRFLCDHGYEYQVVQELNGMRNCNLLLSTEDERKTFLTVVRDEFEKEKITENVKENKKDEKKQKYADQKIKQFANMSLKRKELDQRTEDAKRSRIV